MPFNRPASDTPFGLLPLGNPMSVRSYLKDSSASRIFEGDVVLLSNDGCVDVAATGTETNIVGVAAQGSAASTEENVLVYDHPNQEYMVQDDSDSGFVTQTNVGNNAAIVVTTGNTSTGRSKHELDISSAGASAAPLHIKGLHGCETSFATAAGSPRRLVVKINAGNHVHATSAGI